jgi:Uma2 family endonuclease
MMFASFATLEAERLRPVTRAGREDSVELEGTPDLVVEVVSDSSVRKDRVALREAYHGAGVPEYWIIDARGESVDFEILWLESDGYRASAEPASAQPSRVLARTFRIDRERDRLGQWRYQLRS